MSILLMLIKGQEGLDLHSAGLKLHLSKQVLKSRFPCEMPQAFLTSTPFWCVEYSSPHSPGHIKTPTAR
jgi:hypothetical protein